jgi:hypothetical protein
MLRHPVVPTFEGLIIIRDLFESGNTLRNESSRLITGSIHADSHVIYLSLPHGHACFGMKCPNFESCGMGYSRKSRLKPLKDEVAVHDASDNGLRSLLYKTWHVSSAGERIAPSLFSSTSRWPRLLACMHSTCILEHFGPPVVMICAECASVPRIRIQLLSIRSRISIEALCEQRRS